MSVKVWEVVEDSRKGSNALHDHMIVMTNFSSESNQV